MSHGTRAGRGSYAKEKPRSMRGSWRTILRYLGEYKALLVLSISMIFAESLFNAVAPEYIAGMTDLISDGMYSGNIDLDGITQYALIALALYILAVLAMISRQYWMSGIAQNVARRMRTDLWKKLERLPLSFYDGCRKGDVISRFTNDTDTVGSALGRSLPIFSHGLILLVVCIVMMLIMDVTLALVSMASAGAGMLISGLVIRYTQDYYRSQQDNIGRMYGMMSELYGSHHLVMAYSASKGNREAFDAINESLRASGFRSEVTMGLLPAVMKFFGNIGYVAVCIVGSVMVIDGATSIGVVVAFILYVRMFMGPLDMISHSLGNMQAAGAGAERIQELLDAEEMPEDASKVRLDRVEGKVEFRDVRFGYAPGQETIRGFSATIEPGQKVAIVGATGAGKTTTVNLVMRFYDVADGDILIDGVSIRDMSRRDVHDMFCMVLQDTWLFEGTIRDNIAYCRDVSDDEVMEAVRKVGLEMYVESLPDGLDTRIGQRTSMSEGQRQQICIARALVDRSPMLILDEATSSVDTRTELVIQRAIDSMMEGRTSFVIAHRLSTIRNADVILVMKDGNIAEKGTHEELLRKGRIYADLYSSQFEDGE